MQSLPTEQNSLYLPSCFLILFTFKSFFSHLILLNLFTSLTFNGLFSQWQKSLACQLLTACLFYPILPLFPLLSALDQRILQCSYGNVAYMQCRGGSECCSECQMSELFVILYPSLISSYHLLLTHTMRISLYVIVNGKGKGKRSYRHLLCHTKAHTKENLLLFIVKSFFSYISCTNTNLLYLVYHLYLFLSFIIF